MDAAKLIKKIKEEYNISSRELADRCRLPRSYVEQLEKGQIKFTADALKKILSVYDVDFDEDQIIKLNNVSNISARLLGERIRVLREEKGYTLEKLSKLCDISVTHLSEIERGCSIPSLPTLSSIASALDAPISFFIISKSDHNVVAEKLKAIRKQKGLTQKELAKKSGLSPGLIGQLETGRVQASLKTLQKLSEVLGVSICYLILERDEIDAMMVGMGPDLRELLFKPKVQMLIGSICQLDKDSLGLIFDFIDMVKKRKERKQKKSG